uniref:Uncharacterized protein n=1 Tax=Siphoviridae sp. ctNLX12 TaxID=2825469 RepID=A0A8S5UDT0_9CAUD|nr:MAG TPA: hypothetical protein [Siphoviridae sp. ctNLX12]
MIKYIAAPNIPSCLIIINATPLYWIVIPSLEKGYIILPILLFKLPFKQKHRTNVHVTHKQFLSQKGVKNHG